MWNFDSKIWNSDSKFWAWNSKMLTRNSKFWLETRNSIKTNTPLDKYNIFLFISNSIKDFKLNQYWNFQPILSMRFQFMKYFVNNIISGVSHRLLYCVFTEVNFWKIENTSKIHISSKPGASKVSQSRM